MTDNKKKTDNTSLTELNDHEKLFEKTAPQESCPPPPRKNYPHPLGNDRDADADGADYHYDGIDVFGNMYHFMMVILMLI